MNEQPESQPPQPTGGAPPAEDATPVCCRCGASALPLLIIVAVALVMLVSNLNNTDLRHHTIPREERNVTTEAKMKSARELIHLATSRKEEIINITGEVASIVAHSGVQEGMALIYPMHTSSAVYVSDSDTSLTDDFLDLLEALSPKSGDYRHDRVDHKRNAAAHLKAILAGHHVVLPVTDGRPDLGTYQTIYYAEFDGQRPKEVLVKVIGE